MPQRRNISQRQPMILACVLERGSVTAAEVAESVETTYKNAHDWLRHLSKKGLIQQQNGRWSLSRVSQENITEYTDELDEIDNPRVRSFVWIAIAVLLLYNISRNHD